MRKPTLASPDLQMRSPPRSVAPSSPSLQSCALYSPTYTFWVRRVWSLIVGWPANIDSAAGRTTGVAIATASNAAAISARPAPATREDMMVTLPQGQGVEGVARRRCDAKQRARLGPHHAGADRLIEERGERRPEPVDVE